MPPKQQTPLAGALPKAEGGPAAAKRVSSPRSAASLYWSLLVRRKRSAKLAPAVQGAAASTVATVASPNTSSLLTMSAL